MTRPSQPAGAVAILGLGLMGGSLGLALRARGFTGRLTGYARRDAVGAEARRRGVADEVFETPAAAARGAELVVICVPVRDIPPLVAEIASSLAPHAVVTDVGSTKAWVVERSEAALGAAGPRFVGSHPIAGSEKQGLDAAAATLYENALTVVTPRAETDPSALSRVAALWRFVGARVVELSPEEHDRRLARTSHLPHLVAAVLAATAGRDGEAELFGAFCGAGFRDTTRVADGSPEVWEDIVRTNPAAILAEMEAFAARWRAAADALRAEDYAAVRRWLEEGRAGRRALLARAEPVAGESR